MNVPYMPAVFFGHGNPMNVLSENDYTNGWASIGKSIPRPEAIVSVSAHGYIPFSTVTTNANPPTIHDFDGFPEELYEMEYPAPGSPALAKTIRDLLAPVAVRPDDSWGLDHGTWMVLKHLFPKADIPVVQLSIDETQPPQFHYDIGNRLMPLREAGILVMGSGNIVHNLRTYAWDNRGIEPFDWALRFEEHVKNMLIAGNDGPIIDYMSFGQDAKLSVPTPDHYLPLLYVLGLRRKDDPISFPVQGVDGGSVSMLAVQVG
jgi:4,5-DOPA dioxygenase extradiol